jgi:hypothetical protein
MDGTHPVLLLGLSRLNCERLLAHQPIKFDTTELGLPAMTVVIMAGETEDAITAQLQVHGLITDDTAQRQP